MYFSCTLIDSLLRISLIILNNKSVASLLTSSHSLATISSTWTAYSWLNLRRHLHVHASPTTWTHTSYSHVLLLLQPLCLTRATLPRVNWRCPPGPNVDGNQVTNIQRDEMWKLWRKTKLGRLLNGILATIPSLRCSSARFVGQPNSSNRRWTVLSSQHIPHSTSSVNGLRSFSSNVVVVVVLWMLVVNGQKQKQQQHKRHRLWWLLLVGPPINVK